MRFGLLVVAGLVGAAVTSAPAGAQTIIDRVQVGVPELPVTRGFAENLSVGLKAPKGFERGCCYDFDGGEWLGPAYVNSAAPGFRNASSITWEVALVRDTSSAASVARRSGWADFPSLRARAVKVRHIVAGRRVGTLPGFLALDAQPAPAARAQATVAIDFGRGLKSAATFTNGAPVTNRGGGGAITVDGLPAAKWNRKQLKSAVRGLFVEGSLPPAKVRARSVAGKIKGTATDRYSHPVAEAPVSLQKRRRGSWKNVSSGRTADDGAFSLAPDGQGAYRVLVALAGSSAKSATIRLGR